MKRFLSVKKYIFSRCVEEKSVHHISQEEIILPPRMNEILNVTSRALNPAWTGMTVSL
jgi:hypothetical protein